MWIARFGSTANRWWNVELHVPMNWRRAPNYDITLDHIGAETIDRVRLAFPDGDIILKGVYFVREDQ